VTGRQSTLEYLTKLVVLTSTAAALLVAAGINADGWSAALPLTIGAFIVAGALSVWKAPVAAAIVLLFAYTFPAFVAIAPGQYGDAYTDIWMAALFGVMLPESVAARGWSVPVRWKIPLALWALTIALVWPFVALRQMDFVPAVLNLPHGAVSIRGVVPLTAILWVVNVALTLGLGILWFEWLFLVGQHSPDSLRLRIVPSLVVSWMIATAVALYQLFVDVTFLNSGTFGFLGRVSGTMRDANVFGVIAALCGPAVVVLCRWLPARFMYPSIAAGLLLSWIGVWASGSRTALAAAFIALAFMLAGVRRASIDAPRRRRSALAALVLACGVFLVLARWGPSSVDGSMERLRNSLPTASAASVSAFAYELLWRRQAYGTVAVAMIREHPLLGVGVGSFHLLTADFGALTGYEGHLVPDNAQNWFRHQLAEFGILGGLGWIAWVVMFVVFLLRAPIPAADRFTASTIKGALVGLGLISLVGMPTQHIAVTLTFWTFAYWYVSVAKSAVETDQTSTPAGGSFHWAVVLALAITCSLGTWYLARHELRIANMARRVGWDYTYGLYDAERDPDGRAFRWTMRRAVAVIPAPKPWLKLTVLVNHADLAAKPVDAKVWRDGALVFDERITRVAAATTYVRVPNEDTRVTLDFWCSRVARPRDYGVNDPRDLGLQVSWEFVEKPPANGTIATADR
jgi:hypothetical protein